MSTPASLLHSVSADKHELPLASPESPRAWKAELDARLREHRQRRGRGPVPPADAGLQSHQRTLEKTASASKVAARVAERYSNAPTYQALLAASAAAAAIAAKTAAEAAQAAHVAAQAALADCDYQEESRAADREQSHTSSGKSTSLGSNTPEKSVYADPCSNESHLGKQFQEDQGKELPFFCAEKAMTPPAAEAPRATSVEHYIPLPERASLPARTPVARRISSLVDAFAEAVVPPAQSLPAKLIEFPRELIASRKQRPRLAEGPLLTQQSSGIALRIFEVEAHAGESLLREPAAREPNGLGTSNQQVDRVILGEPAPPCVSPLFYASHEEDRHTQNSDGATVIQAESQHEEDPALRRHVGFHDNSPEQASQPIQHNSFVGQASGWGSIQLGEHPQIEAVAEPVQPAARRPEHGYKAETAPPLHDLAPITDRLMAALVDGGIVFGCFLLSVLVFASCTTHPPVGKAALAAAFLLLTVLATFYGWLFMCFSGGSTPGMRYARISLCTFNDENPTRKDLQSRIPATALALLPLGLGVLWALLDEDKLGWHDRMTRTYQRSYR